MLAACDDGPSICSTFRDGTEPSLSQRAGQSTLRGGATQAAIAPSPRMEGAKSSRMTPRVPNAGEVSSRLTPRRPNDGDAQTNRHASHRGAPSSRPAYRAVAGGKQFDISPVQMGSLERDKVRAMPCRA